MTACLTLASTANLVTAVSGLRAASSGTPNILHGVRVIAYMLTFGLAMTPMVLFSVGAAAIAATYFGMAIVPCSLAATGMLWALLPLTWWLTGHRFLTRELKAQD